jgi:hypothetical protein
MLSRNISRGLPLDSAQHPGRAQMSSTSQRKPEISVTEFHHRNCSSSTFLSCCFFVEAWKVIFNSVRRDANLLLGSPVAGCHLLALGQACSAAFPRRKMEELYRSDSVPRFSLVRGGCATGRWGWRLGRRGYGRRRLGKPVKRLLDEAETGLLKPSSWRMMMIIAVET